MRARAKDAGRNVRRRRPTGSPRKAETPGECPRCAEGREAREFLQGLTVRLQSQVESLTSQIVTLSDPLAEARVAQARLAVRPSPPAPERPDPRRQGPPTHSPGTLRRVPATGPVAPATLTPEQIEAAFER